MDWKVKAKELFPNLDFNALSREETLFKLLEETKSLIDEVIERKASPEEFFKLAEKIRLFWELTGEKGEYLKELMRRRDVSCLFVYREVPVFCKFFVEEVENDMVALKTKGKCLFLNVLSGGEHVYLDVGKRHLLCEVVQVQGDRVFLKALELSVPYPLKRRFIRVETPPIDVELVAGKKPLRGKLRDISVGGIGVFLEETPFEEGEDLEVFFHIDTGTVFANVRCTSIHQKGKVKLVGFRFIDLSKTSEDIIGRYVVKRQMEILRELRRQA